MGLFSQPKAINTPSEYSFKHNFLKVNGDFLEIGGLIGTARVHLDAIETVAYSVKVPGITMALKIIGCGVVLAEVNVGVDIMNEVQEWILTAVKNHKKQ